MRLEKKHMLLVLVLLLAFSLVSITGCGPEEVDYPRDNIQVVVPYSAGGGTDTVARAVGQFVDLDQPFVVTNITGGGGVIGTTEVIGAEPDGHTILIHSVTAMVAGYHAGLFDEKAFEQLEPVASLVSQVGTICVSADSDWETLDQVVDYAKEHPGEITIGVPGLGGGSHIIGAVFEETAGIDVTFVPFDGAADVRAALAGGHIDISTPFISEVYDFIVEGDFRMLAHTGSERIDLLPEVPTLTESGVDFVLYHRNGAFAPKGTPSEVIAILESAIKAAVESDEFAVMMEDMLIEADFLGTDDFHQELRALDSTIEPIGHLLRDE